MRVWSSINTQPKRFQVKLSKTCVKATCPFLHSFIVSNSTVNEISVKMDLWVGCKSLTDKGLVKIASRQTSLARTLRDRVLHKHPIPQKNMSSHNGDQT